MMLEPHRRSEQDSYIYSVLKKPSDDVFLIGKKINFTVVKISETDFMPDLYRSFFFSFAVVMATICAVVMFVVVTMGFVWFRYLYCF